MSMQYKKNNILSLDHTKVLEHFLKEESYINFSLPKYFNFSDLLNDMSDRVNILDISSLQKAKLEENVNYLLYANKDGKYSWRKYELINPVLYISLVKIISQKETWELIVNKLDFQKDSIRCVSLPAVSNDDFDQRSMQVQVWFNEIERESIKLALDFEYLYQTDITNCYGAIYTHSISWALHGKDEAKSKRGYEQLVGNKIDHHLQAMSFGQTNGIPQGSVLMDLIAELVLAYADQELSLALQDLDSEQYKILRYRDDYRIFVRSPEVGEMIMKHLSMVLAGLGMSLNTSKTKKSDNVILDSIKSDKLFSLNILGSSEKNMRDELLQVYLVGHEYPNSGSVEKRLSWLASKFEDYDTSTYHREIISVLTNIGFDNPKSFPIAMEIASKILEKHDNLNEKAKIIEQIFRKIRLLPNNGFLEVWLQRIFIKDSQILQSYKDSFNDLLPQLILEPEIVLFNNSWHALDPFEENYIDYNILADVDNVIEDDEVSLSWYLNR